MKKIYEWAETKDNFVDDTVEKTDAEGKSIRVVEKVNKPITETYFIAKPSFSIKQESNLYYESVVAECIKRGIFSTIQLRKRFIDDGGILSLTEKTNYEKLWTELWEKKSELNKLNEAPDDNKDKIKELNEVVLKILSDLQTIEEKSGNNLLYEHTAEKIAGDRTSLWLALMLSYKDLGGDKQEPFFGKGTFEERMKKYEDIESDEDAPGFKLVQKLLLITSLWYFNKCQTKEDFDNVLAMAETKNLFNQ